MHFAVVFRDIISCCRVRGFISNEGVKRGITVNSRYFSAVGSSSVKRLHLSTGLLFNTTSTDDELSKRYQQQ